MPSLYSTDNSLDVLLHPSPRDMKTKSQQRHPPERADELDVLQEAIEDESDKGAGGELDLAKLLGDD